MAIFGTPDEKETKKSERQKEREAYVQEENDQKRIGQDGKTYKFPLDRLM